MNFKYIGIILNKFDIGETDRLYSIYTLEAGKIRARAIGVKKPNAKLAGNLEPVTQAEIFMARGRGRGNITGAITTNNFLEIKSDISALENIFYVFGIINRIITDEEKDESLYLLLLKYLETINSLSASGKSEKQDIVTAGFLIKLLDSLGYRIEAEKCVKCGEKLKQNNNYFSAERGGILCEKCEKQIIRKVKIGHNAIKLIRLFLVNKIENFSKIEVEKGSMTNLKAIIREEMNWIIG